MSGGWWVGVGEVQCSMKTNEAGVLGVIWPRLSFSLVLQFFFHF